MNPVIGCNVGCSYCYARNNTRRFHIIVKAKLYEGGPYSNNGRRKYVGQQIVSAEWIAQLLSFAFILLVWAKREKKKQQQ